MRGSSREIRVDNRFAVLRQVLGAAGTAGAMGAGGASRRDLVERTGLSLATVATLVTELLDAGLLVEVGSQDSAGGRPRALLGMNTSGPALLGVDMAETYVQVDLFDASLRSRAGVREPVRVGGDTPEQVVARIIALVQEVLTGSGVRAADVLGVGVSVPGQVDRAGGVSVFAPNQNWRDVPLHRLLSGGLDLPLFLDNPLKAIAVAEMWFGAGRTADDVAVVDLGTGVGVGLALGGTLYRGPTNGAGEWGHTLLVLDGRACRCGRSGCIEAYIGARGIMQTLREVDPDSPMLHDDDQTRTVLALAEGLDRADAVALAVVSRTGDYLGAGLADLLNLVNPEAVVVCGWVADILGVALLDRAREVAGRAALPTTFSAARIDLSVIDRNQVTLGAALLALEGFLRGLGPPPGRPGRPRAASGRPSTP